MYNVKYSLLEYLPHSILSFSVQMVRLTFDHGLSKYSSVGFCALGAALCVHKDYATAYKYGLMGLALLKKHRCKELVPAVYNLFFTCICPFNKPIHDVFRPLLKAHQTSRKLTPFTLIRWQSLTHFCYFHNEKLQSVLMNQRPCAAQLM